MLTKLDLMDKGTNALDVSLFHLLCLFFVLLITLSAVKVLSMWHINVSFLLLVLKSFISLLALC